MNFNGTVKPTLKLPLNLKLVLTLILFMCLFLEFSNDPLLLQCTWPLELPLSIDRMQ